MEKIIDLMQQIDGKIITIDMVTGKETYYSNDFKIFMAIIRHRNQYAIELLNYVADKTNNISRTNLLLKKDLFDKELIRQDIIPY